jgi:AraC-like DNA-binding protein
MAVASMATMRNLLSDVDLLDLLQRSPASVGQTVYPPGGSWGPQWLDMVSLVTIHSGSARVWSDDRAPIDVPAGWATLRLPYHEELAEFDRETETRQGWCWLRLTAPPPAALLERLEALPPALPISATMANLLEDALAAANAPLSTAHPLSVSLAAATIWRYVGEAESAARGRDDPVQRARHFLHAHMHDPGLDLSAVAAAAHVSAPHLVRRFRRELGITPMAYLWRRRVAAGVDLLTSTGLSVGEIATRSGFATVYHFSRRVKAQTGMSPTEIRRRSLRRGDPDGDRRGAGPGRPPG